MVSNPNFYGQSTTLTPINQIKDGVDFPHTGLLKSLSLGIAQNYAISGFNITINGATSIDVAAGVIFRDGLKEDISATASSLTLSSSYTNGYHLLVVNSSDTIVLRTPSAADKVPEYSSGDTIIAVITHDGNNPMPIQYLTVNKTEHGISIGYNDSGFTESGKITGDNDSLDIVSTITNADINLTPNGTGDVKLGNLKIDGDQTVGSGQDGYVLTYTHSNGKAALAAASGGGDVVDDTTPQLGGTLESNGNLIKFGDSASATDDRLFFGAGDDLGIWHDGSQSHIYSPSNAVYVTGGGNLYLRPKNGENGIILNTDGAAEVYHDNTKVMETVSGGAKVIGDLEVSGVQYSQFKDLTGDLATGWHTIALIEGRSGGTGSGTGASSGQRGIGTFLIRNTDASRHQTVILTASHLFGTNNGNGISIEHTSYYSTLGINGFRLKENDTYDGAVLQINIADATNDIEVFLKNNFQDDGWNLIDAVADATDPSTASLGLGYNNAYSTFTAVGSTTITSYADLGQHIQGQLSVGDIRTQNGIEINGDLDHDGTNIGFFGGSVQPKQTVGNLTASAMTPPAVNPTAVAGFEPTDQAMLNGMQTNIQALETKINALIDALQAYGLIT